ncbi:hypothetical protein BpHYR1_036594 [Brachionus plicatilis]|uniref:Uncharacterized protein n=1 Tax=Brachionus plicatilis TaxID=10195 RepID=A0A3M7T391_BRAPC|nr:hypothetical protein BpHYR1_036594 [Brachionus plicatilis]
MHTITLLPITNVKYFYFALGSTEEVKSLCGTSFCIYNMKNNYPFKFKTISHENILILAITTFCIWLFFMIGFKTDFKQLFIEHMSIIDNNQLSLFFHIFFFLTYLKLWLPIPEIIFNQKHAFGSNHLSSNKTWFKCFRSCISWQRFTIRINFNKKL